MVGGEKDPRTKTDRGASDVFMIMLLGLLVAFAGLAYDMGMVFNAKREVTNIAGSAARAGANQVDEDELYARGIAKIHPGDALGAAQARIPADVRHTTWDISDNDEEVLVGIERDHETLFLGIIGFDSFTITGEATARVQNGAG